MLRFLQLLPAEFAHAPTYNLALKACADARDLRAALRVVDIMGIRQVPTDFIHFTTLIAGEQRLACWLWWAGPPVAAWPTAHSMLAPRDTALQQQRSCTL